MRRRPLNGSPLRWQQWATTLLALLLLSPVLTVCSASASAAAAEVGPVRLLVTDAEHAGDPWVDPGHRTGFASRQQPLRRLKVQPEGGAWPQGPWVLVIEGLGMQRARRIDVASTPAWLLAPRPAGVVGHGRIGFVLDPPPPAGGPVEIEIDARDVIAGPIALHLQPLDAFLRADAAWLAFASAMLAVMLALAGMALLFGLHLRDSTFGWYAAYLIAYVWILGLQTGLLAVPLGLPFEFGAAPLSGRIATMAAVVCAALFLDRFARLKRHAPRMRILLFALMVGICSGGLLSLMPQQELRDFGRALTNPLLIFGGPVLLLAAVWAGLRGARYGWVFAVGWAPLLAATVAGSLQLYGFFPGVLWLGSAALAAGAFEALVLSGGLAHRSRELRRERDQVRKLADGDPLTGLLNRRAFSERVQAFASAQPEASLSVLFIDIDHFKALNDALGHDAGDEVLRQVADALSQELRGAGLLARHGGEELVVGLPGIALEGALQTAERLRRRVGVGIALPPPMEPGLSAPSGISVSIGVAERLPGESLAALLRRADQAMYQAKARGRDRVEPADAALAQPEGSPRAA